MALIRANDTYTLVEFAFETTYGTAPTYADGSGATGYRRFPFIAETLKLERETLPLSEEFTAFGGLGGVDLGKTRVRGSVTFEPQYNAQWMWMLYGLGFGCENVSADTTLMHGTLVTPANGVNVHLFNGGTTLKSATMLVWKSGPGPDDGSHYVDIVTGLYVTKWTWDQPEGNRARVTLDFIGKAMTTDTADNYDAGPWAIPNGYKVNSQHLGTGSNGGLLLWGTGAADPVNLNLTGFTLTCDRKVDDTSGAFLNEILSANDPGIEGIREVTLSLTTNLETDYGVAGKPWAQWLAGNQSAMHILYDSGQAITTSPASNYGIRFDIPGAVITDAQNSISKAGVQTMTVSATCPLASLTRMGTTYDQWTSNDVPAIPADGLADVRVATVVKVRGANPTGLEEHTDDAKFCSGTPALPDA